MSEDLRPPLTTTTSLWPAAVVLGLAVSVIVGFMLVNVVASPHVRVPRSTVPTVVGGLAPAHSAPARVVCDASHEIPGNVVSSLLNPRQSTVTRGGQIINQGAGDFDCVEYFRTAAASPGDVLAFYASQLGARGWSLFSRGTGQATPQSLFQKAGSDGFYWILGVTILGHSHHDTTWKLQLYQNSETI